MHGASAQAPAAATGWRAGIDALDRWLGRLTEIPAAGLVLANIVVLLAGVVSRYVFHSPLVWSDELAGIMFLWMSMLGAVVALRRGEHMRMTAFVAKASPSVRAFLDVLALAASLAFLLLIAHPAFDYASEEAIVVTPALEISNAWRASALPVGVALMVLVSLLRLLRVSTPARTLGALALVGVLCAAFWWMAPVLMPLGKLNLLIFFGGVVGACVFAGVPIAFSFALATFGFLALTTKT
ncbi:MAG TPA: TRAP transporter small permease, partial [Variovorax sp.]|nr:TRAP transporter small permease [Variovorax sp.]